VKASLRRILVAILVVLGIAVQAQAFADMSAAVRWERIASGSN
jgi:hypothetical protein